MRFLRNGTRNDGQTFSCLSVKKEVGNVKKGMMSGCGALACSLALLFGCAPGGGDQAGETAPYTLDFLTDGSSTEGRYLSDPGQSTAAENAGRPVQKGSPAPMCFP